MSREIMSYTYNTVILPEWNNAKIRIATDEHGVRLASITDVSVSVGVANASAQVSVLQRATKVPDEDGYTLDPDALRQIAMLPLVDAKPHARSNDQWCLRIDEVGWWVGHINPLRVAEFARGKLKLYKVHLKHAADRLYWQGTNPLPALPEPREMVNTTVCCHDGKCPHCQGLVRVQTRDGHLEWLRLA